MTPRRRRTLPALGALLAAVMSMSGASPGRAAGTTATGTLVFHVTLYPNATLANATISIYPSYFLYDAAVGYNPPANWGGATTTVKVVGGKASATITVPYNVPVPSSSYRLLVEVQASAQTSQGANYNITFNGNLAIPANGKTTTFAFNGGL